MGLDIVKGFAEKDDTQRLESARMGMLVEILGIIDQTRERVLTADNPLKEFFTACIERFVERVDLEGIENVPEEGRVVIASNHPFGMPDMTSLMCHLADRQPERPWKCIGNGSLLKKITPDWENDPSFMNWFIPVRRKGGKTFAKAVNRDEVIDASAQFLQEHEDPMLFIAPEGADVAYQNRISRPYKGFAEIARRTGSPIVPVLFTGEADLDTKRFHIRGQVLESFEAANDPATTCTEWVRRLYERLFQNMEETA